MFVHNELEVGSSRQHSQNLTIERQSSYSLSFAVHALPVPDASCPQLTLLFGQALSVRRLPAVLAGRASGS